MLTHSQEPVAVETQIIGQAALVMAAVVAAADAAGAAGAQAA